MAIRIPVVISQSERRTGSMADYEEQLITRLIFENGLDATLIADLKSIATDTTDHLCIEGLKGDFALATWQSAQYVCEHLHRLGIPSLEIVPVDGSPRFQSNQNGTSPKKIFFVSLATNTPIDSTIGTLRDLREARATPVFSIGLPKNGTQSSATKPENVPQAPPLPPLRKAANSTDSTKSERLDRSSTQTNTSDDEGEDFPQLEQLMNDLDKFEM